MNSKVYVGIGAVVLGGIAWFMLTQGTQGGQEVEYRYAPVERGELVLSRSSTGVLVPLTTVDVKSKAGGIVMRLAVEEGTRVVEGDLVAEIDPRDTQALYEQAQADANAAEARVDSAENALVQAERDAANAVKDAELRVRQSQIALARAEQEYETQPELVKASISSARASLRAEVQALNQLRNVEVPQRRRDAETAVRSAETNMLTAEAELERQQELYELGFGAKAPVEQAEASLESARAQYEVAQERMRTLEDDIEGDILASEARVEQAEASLNQAEANSYQVVLAEQDVEAAEKALELANVALTNAKNQELTVRARNIDIRSARANAVRSKVSERNAREQLDFTQVTAPREGVVTLKYLEEGTIIPAGTSTFAEGTSIVQIADTTRMFVECSVDETDIAAVVVDQDVRIVVEAYPGKFFKGKVRKVFPAAESDNSITAVRVRIEVLDLDQIDQDETPLRPGMNADCEFIEFLEPEALLLPQQALKNEDGMTFVLVKTDDPINPEIREVEVGRTGNERVEILSGLEEGEEVVIAEINLAELRERLERIKAAEEGGGLTGGG